ncbi:MAG TPA: fumarylacetoacetate hydrolase family protein [Chitinophagaceae bacterium]|jgi:2-dehydro-3-deoxy-D-arabinonate dehydratase|nr:fumarylacetoacetate hydrolase family protein [Chitinophagaceae bacterium]
MHLYKTTKGNILRREGRSYLLTAHWDALINRPGLFRYLEELSAGATVLPEAEAEIYCHNEVLPPIGSQEVWAAGVTYLRSRDARMDESKDSGAADCYQKVYEAERPELFFKALAHRVSGPGQAVYIRRDSDWNVPEPELTLYLNAQGSIEAYTIGNDMSSRSIEGENPLYLPQAKVYEKSAALGPCLYIPETPVPPETEIRLSIHRAGDPVFTAAAPISRMKRTLPELAGYLFRECDFPCGCFLMTGTCLVPPNDFTLQPGDVVEISIDGIGTLVNPVALKDVPVTAH